MPRGIARVSSGAISSRPPVVSPVGGQYPVEDVVDGYRADEPSSGVGDSNSEGVVGGDARRDVGGAGVGGDRRGPVVEATTDRPRWRLAEQALVAGDAEVPARR